MESTIVIVGVVGIGGIAVYMLYGWLTDDKWPAVPGVAADKPLDMPWDDKPIIDKDFKKPSRVKDIANIAFPEGARLVKILDDFVNPSPSGNTKPSASGPPVRLGPIPKRKT